MGCSTKRNSPYCVTFSALLYLTGCASDEPGVASGGTGNASETAGISASSATLTGGALTSGVPMGGVSTGGASSTDSSASPASTGAPLGASASTDGTSSGGVLSSSTTGGATSTSGSPSSGALTGGSESTGTTSGVASVGGGTGGFGGNGNSSGGGMGGTGGTGGSGESTGTTAATPEPRICILPLGDSITQSNNTHVSYRYWLWEDLIGAGHEFDFIGSTNTHFSGTPTYPNPDFDRDHEGHWGWRVDEINGQIGGWLGGYTPDVVLMHLGTNDAFQNQSADSTIAELTDLVGMLRADNENVVILLAKLIPSTNSQSNLDALNSRFDALAGSLTTAMSPVVIVDQAEGFNPQADTFDGIHPNEGGEQKMAAKWLEALEANWPTQGGACDQ